VDTLAIVILNYNGQSFLAKFLPTVIAHAEGHPIYVADSASTDGSVAFVRANFPGVRLIELPYNGGYAGGYNMALDHIRTHYGGATYYVLPNSDIEVTPGWISPVLSLLEANPQIAACQPKILSYSERTMFEHAGAAGGFVDWLGYVFCRGRVFATFETDHGQYDNNRSIFGLPEPVYLYVAICFTGQEVLMLLSSPIWKKLTYAGDYNDLATKYGPVVSRRSIMLVEGRYISQIRTKRI
jgi:GT2 family glycosyltransferase